MEKIKQIDEKINELKKKLSEVKGTATEVYTRIVGYYRAVDNWNNGKKEEYKERKIFNLGKDNLDKHTFVTLNDEKNNENNEICEIDDKKEKINNIIFENIATFKLFTSQYCPNCPPVKNYMNSLPILGEEIDVSTELGINISKEFSIMSTPTIIFFDKKDNPIYKAYSVEELKKVYSKVNLTEASLKN